MKISKSATAPQAAKTFRFFALVLFLALLDLSACKKDDNMISCTFDDPTEAEDSEILNYLTAAGVDPQDIEFSADYIVYQGDACWNRAALLKTIREAPILNPEEILPSEDGGVSDRQRGLPESSLIDAVAAGTVINLTYYIRPSVLADCGSAWFSAILNGVNNWNIVTNCRVNLTQVSTSTGASIIFASDADPALPGIFQNLPADRIARSEFPLGGTAGIAGRYISINNNASNWNSKLKTIMHEIGHTLGFEHPNDSGASHIHGTPLADANSVMNQGENTTPAFTSGDLRAMRMYYPNNYQTPTNYTAVRDSAGVVRITYRNPDLVGRPYYWIRVNKYSAAGTLITHRYFRSTTNSTGWHTFTWGGHAAGTTFRFRIAGYNFRRDVPSNAPPIVAVTL